MQIIRHINCKDGVTFLNANGNDEDWRWTDQPGKRLVAPDQWKKIAYILGISEREQEVCQLLFDGITREEIAEQMDIKVRTVRHYLERLHTKLRVNNRVALVLRIVPVSYTHLTLPTNREV